MSNEITEKQIEAAMQPDEVFNCMPHQESIPLRARVKTLQTLVRKLGRESSKARTDVLKEIAQMCHGPNTMGTIYTWIENELSNDG